MIENDVFKNERTLPASKFKLDKGEGVNNMVNDLWNEFLQEIKKAKKELGNEDVIWYRGQNNFENYLLPSLLRYTNGIEKERYLFTSFKKFSDRILQKRDSEWETLFNMQHYEIPTRLLDWSETFGIALYFAAYYNSMSTQQIDAAVYLLNPLKLNNILRIKKIYRIPDEENEFSYTGIYWEQKPFAPSSPIAIEPIFINGRMLAQRGVFTVYGDSIEPIEEAFPDVVKKVRLPKAAIPAALDFLELSNINAYTVYPDLPGIADFLKKSSGLVRRI